MATAGAGAHTAADRRAGGEGVLRRRGGRLAGGGELEVGAEARFLRAYSYWHGIDLFGDIPLVKETDALTSTPPQQATRATYVARRAGIFPFVCAVAAHLPVMSGQLVVLARGQSEDGMR